MFDFKIIACAHTFYCDAIDAWRIETREIGIPNIGFCEVIKAYILAGRRPKTDCPYFGRNACSYIVYIDFIAFKTTIIPCAPIAHPMVEVGSFHTTRRTIAYSIDMHRFGAIIKNIELKIGRTLVGIGAIANFKGVIFALLQSLWQF